MGGPWGDSMGKRGFPNMGPHLDYSPKLLDQLLNSVNVVFAKIYPQLGNQLHG